MQITFTDAGGNAASTQNLTASVLDSPSTTSEITYKTTYGVDNAANSETIYIAWGNKTDRLIANGGRCLMADKTQAILALEPNAKFTIVGDEITSWESDDIEQPTETEINAKIAELNILEDRKIAYGNITDQLDKLWHDINDGKLDKTGTWFLAIKKVKDDNPK